MDRELLWGRCGSAGALHQWIKTYLEIDVPRVAVCEGHQAPFEYLWRAYDEPTKDLVVWAPRGGGKTRLGAVATLLDLMHKPEIAVRILGGSLEQSLRMWEHLVRDMEMVEVGYGQGRSNWKTVRLANGSGAAVLTQSQRAVRGLRIQKLRCDEVELFDPEVWEAAQLVTKSSQLKDQRVSGVIEAFSTWHKPFGLMQKVIDRSPGRVVRWCLLEVLEKCPKTRVCETCLLYEECRGRAKEKEGGFFSIDDAIEMKRRVSRETWESEMMCLRPSMKGAVFKTFKFDVHVGERELGNDIWLGIDFGYNNPFVCLWIARNDAGIVYVIDEYVQSQRTVAEHLVEIEARQWKSRSVACDPAGASKNEQTAKSNLELLRNAGYRVRTKGSRITEGLEKIRAGLQSGSGDVKLFINPRCQKLIKAMQAYRYPEKGGEIPLKDNENDHLIDALRYYFVNWTNSSANDVRTY